MSPYDSILTATDSNVINRTVYYAIGDSVPEHDLSMIGRGYAVGTDDVVCVGLLLMFAAIAVVFSHSHNRMVERLRGYFSAGRRYHLANMGDTSAEAYNVFLLTSVAALSLTLISFCMAAERYGFSTVLGIPHWLFAAGYVLLMLFVYVKIIIYSVVNWVFFDRESSRSWLSSYLFITSLLAYATYPLALLCLFSDIDNRIVIWCAVFVIVLYELVLIFRLFVNFYAKNYGILLIFLYFCTVELVPTLMLWHIFGWAGDLFIEANVIY